MKSYSLSHLHRDFSLIWHKFTAFLLNHIANEASSQSINQSIKHSINQLINLLISKMKILFYLARKRCICHACIAIFEYRLRLFSWKYAQFIKWPINQSANQSVKLTQSVNYLFLQSYLMLRQSNTSKVTMEFVLFQ